MVLDGSSESNPLIPYLLLPKLPILSTVVSGNDPVRIVINLLVAWNCTPPVSSNCLIALLVISHPPILPPSNNTWLPVICPDDFNLSCSEVDFISESITSKPAIDADANLANPSEFIDELAFAVVDGEPPIVAGVLILSTVMLPCTVNVSSSNCK